MPRPLDMTGILAELARTAVGETRRIGRCYVQRQMRDGRESYDTWAPGYCTCGAPTAERLSRQAAADAIWAHDGGRPAAA